MEIVSKSRPSTLSGLSSCSDRHIPKDDNRSSISNSRLSKTETLPTSSSLADSIPEPCSLDDFQVLHSSYAVQDSRSLHWRQTESISPRRDISSHTDSEAGPSKDPSQNQTNISSSDCTPDKINHLELPRKLGQRRSIYYSLEISPIVTMLWETELTTRFDRLLRESEVDIIGSVAVQPALVGKKKTLLSPHILILCSHERQRKMIHDTLRQDYWTQLKLDTKIKGMGILVLIDKNLGARARRQSVASHASALDYADLPLPVAISYSSEGLLPYHLEAFRSSFNDRNDNTSELQQCPHEPTASSASHEALLGGFISVDGRIYGLTIGHIFIEHSRLRLNTEASVDLSGDSYQDEDDGCSSDNSFWDTLAGNSDEESGTDCKDDSPPTLASTKKSLYTFQQDHRLFDASIVAYNVGAESISKLPNENSIRRVSQHNPCDWGLVEFDCMANNASNYNISSLVKASTLSGIMESSKFPSKEAVIYTARKTMYGCTLGESFALIQIHGHRLKAWPVSLNEPLLSGDSGAWVISQNRLCGVIAAGSDLLSLGYMISAEDIFTSISLHFNAVNVCTLSDFTLTQALTRWSQSKARERVTFGLIRTDRHSHTESDSIAVDNTVLEAPHMGSNGPALRDEQEWTVGVLDRNKEKLSAQSPERKPDPKMSIWLQLVLLISLSLMVFSAQLGSPSIAAAIPSMIPDESPRSLLGALIVSAYFLGNIVGVFICRTQLNRGFYWVFNGLNCLFIAFSIGCALTQPSSPLFILFRALQGLGSSAVIDLTPVILKKDFISKRLMPLIWLFSFIESIVGPVFCGYVAETEEGWKIIFWFLMSTFTASTIACNIVFLIQGDHQYDTTQYSLTFLGVIRQPHNFFRKSTRGFFMDIYISVLIGFLRIIFVTAPTQLSNAYEFGSGATGCILLAAGLGQFAGSIVEGILRAFGVSVVIRCLLGILAPLGLYLYGWTVQYSLRWIGAASGLFSMGLGINILWNSFLALVHQNGAQLLIETGYIGQRSITTLPFAGLLPLAGPSLYSALDDGIGNSLLGSIGVGLGLVFVIAIWMSSNVRVMPFGL